MRRSRNDTDMTGKKIPTEQTVAATAEPATGKESLQVAVIPPVSFTRDPVVTEVRFRAKDIELVKLDGLILARDEWTEVPRGFPLQIKQWPELEIETRTRPAVPAQE